MRACLTFLLLLALTNVAAAAGARVWIAEFQTGRIEAAAPIANLPAAVTQPTLDITIGVATSLKFSATTKLIRVVCEVQCAIRVNGIAAANMILLPKLVPEYFGVPGGGTMSAIAVP